MPELPAGTDRNRLVVVRPKNLPDGADPVEHIVGAAYVTAFPDDVEFLRFDGETPEQADAREQAAAAAEAETAKAAKAASSSSSSSRSDAFA